MKTTSRQDNVRCLSKPASMPDVLALHYPDFPLSKMPPWATRILARRWRNRPDVYYVEARTQDDEYMGYLFGHAIGETPWKTLFADPKWMTPAAVLPLVARRLEARRGGSGYSAAAPEIHPDIQSLAPLPEGLLSKQRYLKVQYIEVDPKFRGRGVAVQLYNATEQEARRDGLSMLSARISLHNYASVRAFQKSGYTVYMNAPRELRAVKELDPL